MSASRRCSTDWSDGSWRWSTCLAVLGVPLAVAILRQREPARGEHESNHILRASGFDETLTGDGGPKVLFGPALTRLLRIRSLYYQLVAVCADGSEGPN